MKDTEIKDLIDRYLRQVRSKEGSAFQKELTPEEKAALEQEAAIIEDSFNLFASKVDDYSGMPKYEAASQEVWTRLAIPLKTPRIFPFVRYAAALVAIVGITWGYLSFIHHKQQTQNQTVNAKEIKPGGNKAILTLANGKEISLNTQSGSVATIPAQGLLISNNASTGIVTFKNASKQEGNNHDNTIAGGSNTITTPPGGQYQLVLPDGTRVFLNASSTIHFPSSFASKTRSVSISGEAYFDVAKDATHPFQVKTEDQLITVLGTKFNVSAYPSETVKTTLAEGKVVLLQPSTGISQPLKPDQQALLLRSSTNGFEIKNVTSSEEIAWIDGMFIFSDTPLREAMKQISRWYNIEVDYSDSSLSNEQLTANLSRSLTLAEVLETIAYTHKYKYTLQGRRLILAK